MTKTELTTLLGQELKDLSSSLDDNDYSNAISDAERETWSMPQSADFKIKWIKERAKRHLFFYLGSESASKFRYKNIYLQHRFDHYMKLVDRMDKEFEQAIKDDPYQFADVSSYEAVGTKIDAGFAYQGGTGKDYTYDEDNEVLIHPNENS